MKERLSGLPLIQVGVTLRQGIYLLLQDRRRLEPQTAASRYGCWLPSLRIAAKPLSLLVQHERTERAQLHSFAAFQRGGDFLQHLTDERPEFVTGQADYSFHRVG